MNTEAWTARYTFNDILGVSRQLRQTIELAHHAARADYPVVLVGESGTGKELIAHAIHNASARRRGPFIAVNCGMLCGEMAISELCGYEPGSFTGADRHTHQGFSTLRRKAPCSSTNFKICHPLLRVRCCGSWKPAVLSALEAPNKSIVGYGWWSRPTFQSRN